jgi:hypothetical protein
MIALGTWWPCASVKSLLMIEAWRIPGGPSGGAQARAQVGRDVRERSATAGMPSRVAKQVTKPIRNREAPVTSRT